jgi:hypothetical protein
LPPDYVFIVGMPRTGTALTRRILNRSPDVSLAGESHYFAESPRLRFWTNRGFRQSLRSVGDLATDEGVARVVDHIYALRHKGFWGWIAENVERGAFLRALMASDRTDRALLETALRFHGQGRRVWGEKTPANISQVPTLLEWFPGAKIVHTFRDPRASFVSQKRKRQNQGRWWRGSRAPALGVAIDLYSSLRLILSWLMVVRLHRRYERRYAGQYLMLRFEDLVSDPVVVIKQLCDFLGIDFSDAMLDQWSINSSFRRPDEVRGFDPRTVDRWRTELHPLVRRWFSLWCGRTIRAFGYQL